MVILWLAQRLITLIEHIIFHITRQTKCYKYIKYLTLKRKKSDLKKNYGLMRGNYNHNPFVVVSF